MTGWLITEKATEQMLDLVRQTVSGPAADLVEAFLAQNGSPVVESAVQWCWFYGGDSPADAAGVHTTDDEADATEMPQWLVDGGTAWRPLAAGPWVVQPRDTPDHPLPTTKETPTP